METSDSAGTKIITLSRSPNELAKGATIVEVLQTEYAVGGPEGSLTGIQDVAAFDGGVAVADGYADHILLLNEKGEVYDSLGREGEGPGEFTLPYVVAASGDYLLVGSSGGLLTTFSLRAMTFVAQERRPMPGDWANPFFRKPFSQWDRPLQVSLEDVTRRYTGIGEGEFIFKLQDDERLGLVENLERPEVSLILTNPPLNQFDTIAVVDGGPLLPVETSALARYQDYVRPVYSPQPLVAAGTGWLAIGNGSGNSVDVYCGRERRKCASVRWVSQTEPISEEQMLEFVDWEYRYQLAVAEGDHLGWLKGLSAREKRSLAKNQMNITHFVETVPQLTDMLGAADCLFLAGFDPGATYRGVSSTWMVLNLVEGTAKAIQIPGRGFRVRDVSKEFLYATFDGDLLDDNLVALHGHGPLCASDSNQMGPPTTSINEERKNHEN